MVGKYPKKERAGKNHDIPRLARFCFLMGDSAGGCLTLPWEKSAVKTGAVSS